MQCQEPHRGADVEIITLQNPFKGSRDAVRRYQKSCQCCKRLAVSNHAGCMHWALFTPGLTPLWCVISSVNLPLPQLCISSATARIPRCPLLAADISLFNWKIIFLYNQKFCSIDVGLYCLHKTLWRHAGKTDFHFYLLDIFEYAISVLKKLCVNSVVHKFQPGSIQKIRFKMGLFYVLLNVLKLLLMKTAICRVSVGGGLMKKWGFLSLTPAGVSLQEDSHRLRGRGVMFLKQIENLLTIWHMAAYNPVLYSGWNILDLMDHCL